jgi:hypothetical protein
MKLTQYFNQVDLEKTSQNITGKVGITWLYHAMKEFGVNDIIINHFPKRKSNKEINVVSKIMAGTLMLIAGGEKIEDLQLLRSDHALIQSIGLESMISPDTFLNFLANKRNAARLRRVIEDIVVKLMKKDKTKKYTYDNDATYFDSGKKCAAYSYKGQKQMSGLLGFFVELGDFCTTMDYRPGNVSPAKGILNQLRKAIKITNRANKRIKSFRSDSAAHNGQIMRLCNEKRINYYISLSKYNAVNDCIDAINEHDWQDVPDQKNTQWAETVYVMGEENKAISMRMLCLRTELKSDDNNQPDDTSQSKLLDVKSYRYHAIATNNNQISSLDWLNFHNGRMASENNNKELKRGFSCEYSPSNNFHKNRAYFMTSILAYNLTQIMKLLYLPAESKRWTIKTLRYWFINTCGKFIFHANKWKCKIINPTNQTFKMFEYCLSRFVWQC